MKLEDLIVEDWPFENSFNVVSEFLDSKLGISGVTEPKKFERASSPSSVLSSIMSSLHGTTMQTYHAQNRKLEALEISVLSALRESWLDRPLAQLQSIIAAAAPFECATSNIPNNTEVEPMTPHAYKRHGGRPNIFGHNNHGHC